MYLKDRVDFWATANDVQTYSANKVGGSASDSFIADNRTVKIALDHGNPTTTTDYNVNEFTGHLTTAADADTVVYHYMGEASTGKAYFRKVEDKNFLGLEVVEGTPKTYKTYLNERGLNSATPWATKEEVSFSIKHIVGAPKLLLGQLFEKPMNAGEAVVLPGAKETFAALTFGDEIWLMGGNMSVHNSKDRGLTWTYNNTENADGTDKFSEKELDADGKPIAGEDLGTFVWVAANTANTSGVALADNNLVVATPKNVYQSTDGINWTIRYEVVGVTGDDSKITFDTSGFQAFHVTNSDNLGSVPNGIYFISGNGVKLFSADGVNWTQSTITEGNRFDAREGLGFGVAVHKSTLYIMAGWGAAPLDKSANDVWKSTDGGNSWTEVLALKPDVTDGSRWNLRDRIATVSTATHVYLMGGGDSGSSDVWRSEFSSDLVTWELVAEDGGFTPKNSAKVIYYPASSGKKETLLLLGGRASFGPQEVWRSEAE